MGFLTSIRSSLVFISFTAIGLILWLSVSFWYTAYVQRLDSAQLLESIETEDLLFESSRELSRQRSLVQLTMSRVEPANDTHLVKLQRYHDESLVRAEKLHYKIRLAIDDESLSDRFTFVDSEINDVHQNVSSLYQDLFRLNDWIVSQVSMPLVQRNPRKIMQRLINIRH